MVTQHTQYSGHASTSVVEPWRGGEPTCFEEDDLVVLAQVHEAGDALGELHHVLDGVGEVHGAVLPHRLRRLEGDGQQGFIGFTVQSHIHTFTVSESPPQGDSRLVSSRQGEEASRLEGHLLHTQL